MSTLAAATTYLFWYLMTDVVDTFNIDTTNPIVLRSSSLLTNSNRAAYFGFSLAFHRSRLASAPWCEF